MRLLLDIGPAGEIYDDGELYIDPDLEDIGDPLADSGG
jgi:hypothetical protein